MTRKKVLEAIQAATRDNRLTCEKAHELANTLGISLRELGALCDQMKIKIAACQLSCF